MRRIVCSTPASRWGRCCRPCRSARRPVRGPAGQRVVAEPLQPPSPAFVIGLSTPGPIRRIAGRAHLFSGCVYCDCGKRMYPPAGSKKYVCQACRNKIPADDLEHIFIEQLKGFLLSPTEVENYLREAGKTRTEREGAVQALAQEIGATKKQTDTLFKLHEAGEIPLKGFGDRYKPLFERQEALQRQLAEAEAALAILKVDSLSADHILLEGQNLADRWPGLAFEDKRRIVEDLIDQIVIGTDNEVAINLLYFPSPKDGAKWPRNVHVPSQ